MQKGQDKSRGAAESLGKLEPNLELGAMPNMDMNIQWPIRFAWARIPLTGPFGIRARQNRTVIANILHEFEDYIVSRIV